MIEESFKDDGIDKDTVGDWNELLKYYSEVNSNLDEEAKDFLMKDRDFFIKISEQLSPEERMIILSNLENKSCLNCTNGCCRVPYTEKIGVDKFGRPEGSQCAGWLNEELIGRSKVLRRSNIHDLK